LEKVYAQALVELEATGAKAPELTKHLIAHLTKAGRLKLLPKILTELRKIEARHAKEWSALEVASEKEKAHAQKELENMGVHATEVRINPSLIKGWRILQKDTLIDTSAKKSLVNLYTNITNHH
jgi:F0F1-type ATP synthase delta subunit